jgi:hypothetical protein
MGANMDREIMPIIERESNADFMRHMKYAIHHMSYFIFFCPTFFCRRNPEQENVDGA